MARGTWTVQKWNGNAWVADTPIYRPNSNTDITYTSTQQKIRLADGTNAFITPETVYDKEDITFEYLEIDPDDSFYTRIINYIKNGTYLTLTTHLNESIIGKFVSIKRVWLLGIEDTFDFQAVFQRMD